MARPRAERTRSIREYLLGGIPSHPTDIAKRAAEHFGISRQAANDHLRALVREGSIIASGSTRARSYVLAVTRDVRAFPVSADAREDLIWRDWARPFFADLSDNALAICHHGLTEIVNNANDHSEGTAITTMLERTEVSVGITVVDDGIGIFRKIRDVFQLDDEKHAVLELSKGKLTTDPRRHTGEGIFFTSRMFDTFTISAGALFLCHNQDDLESDWLLEDTSARKGTLVTMELRLPANRTAAEVFTAFTDVDGGTYGFDVTHVPVALAKYGDELLVSRSQAKRLVARFDRFRKVVLNFDGVGSIGQAFADEVFRVFRLDHPDVELFYVNATTAVEQMINRAETSSTGQQ